MPRINLTIEEHEAIRPVLEAHRLQAQLKAERIRTLLAVQQAFESAPVHGKSWDLTMILALLSDVERCL